MGNIHSRSESIRRRQWLAEKWGYYIDFDEEGRTVGLDMRRPVKGWLKWDPARPIEPIKGIAAARAAGLLPPESEDAPSGPPLLRTMGANVASGQVGHQSTVSPAKASDAELLLIFSQGPSVEETIDQTDEPAATLVAASPAQSPRKPLADISANAASPVRTALEGEGEVVPGTPPKVLRRSGRNRELAQPAAVILPVLSASGEAARRVAALTRLNTRRNKADATAARVTLDRLRSAKVNSPLPERVWAQKKTVSWDEQLARYRESEAAPTEELPQEQKLLKAKATIGAATASRKRKAAAEESVADAEEHAPKRRSTRAPAKESKKRKAGADRVEDGEGEAPEPKRRVTRSSSRLAALGGKQPLPEPAPAPKGKGRACKARGRKAAKK